MQIVSAGASSISMRHGNRIQILTQSHRLASASATASDAGAGAGAGAALHACASLHGTFNLQQQQQPAAYLPISAATIDGIPAVAC